ARSRMRRAGWLGEARMAERSNTVRPHSAAQSGVTMGKRLSKIYTRTGDDGTTGLGDGSRTPKDSPRVNAYGTTDELNCVIGMVLASPDVSDPVHEALTQVQHDLFDLGGELCIPGMEMVHDADVERLEETLDSFNADLPALKEFILPGGGMAAAQCHLARTVCR